VCGIGSYGDMNKKDRRRVMLAFAPDQVESLNHVGDLRHTHNRLTFRMFKCNHCGHVQFFHFPADDDLPPAWTNSGS